MLAVLLLCLCSVTLLLAAVTALEVTAVSSDASKSLLSEVLSPAQLLVSLLRCAVLSLSLPARDCCLAAAAW